MAKAGPTPIIDGGTPTTEKSTYLPIIGSPNLLAALLEAKRTTAAPSVIWELFPAVLHPFGLNAGRNFCKSYNLVGLGPSS